MAMATTPTAAITGLSDKTLNRLRELRRLNIDSAKGFEECAELVKDHGVKKAFGEMARERREQAQVLATQIEWNDKTTDPGVSTIRSGSTAAAALASSRVRMANRRTKFSKKVMKRFVLFRTAVACPPKA